MTNDSDRIFTITAEEARARCDENDKRWNECSRLLKAFQQDIERAIKNRERSVESAHGSVIASVIDSVINVIRCNGFQVELVDKSSCTLNRDESALFSTRMIIKW